MFLQPRPPAGRLALAHQHVHHLARFFFNRVNADFQRAAGVGAHGGVEQLLGVHLAQALEAGNLPAALTTRPRSRSGIGLQARL